jgi:PadR family transcriptional regulator AphA
LTTASSSRELLPGEWSILALLADEPTHGWALSKEMAPTGSVGKVWAMGRPLVYRTLELLESRGLVAALGLERGARGPKRALFGATDAGRTEVARWLAQPVGHVHEMRSVFLLKLVLLQRAGLDRQPLLRAQRALVADATGELEARLRSSIGVENILARFRLENSRSMLTFIDTELGLADVY